MIMAKLTCEQVIDSINHYLRANGTGEQIRKDNKYQISIIAGIVDSINSAMENKDDDR